MCHRKYTFQDTDGRGETGSVSSWGIAPYGLTWILEQATDPSNKRRQGTKRKSEDSTPSTPSMQPIRRNSTTQRCMYGNRRKEKKNQAKNEKFNQSKCRAFPKGNIGTRLNGDCDTYVCSRRTSSTTATPKLNSLCVHAKGVHDLTRSAPPRHLYSISHQGQHWSVADLPARQE